MKENIYSSNLGMASASDLHNYIQNKLQVEYSNYLDDSKFTILPTSNIFKDIDIEIIPDIVVKDDKKNILYCIEIDHKGSNKYTKDKYQKFNHLLPDFTEVYNVIYSNDKSKVSFELFKLNTEGQFEDCKNLPLLKKKSIESYFAPYQEKMIRL